VNSTSRCLMKPSRRMKIIPKIAINEIVDPTDDMMFHGVYASGKSEYRRGIPLSPKKCCGKNVRFTPTNITEN